jgi:hypothetical protein
MVSAKARADSSGTSETFGGAARGGLWVARTCMVLVKYRGPERAQPGLCDGGIPDVPAASERGTGPFRTQVL